MRGRWWLSTLLPLLSAAGLAAIELREAPIPSSALSPSQFTERLDASIPRWMRRDHVPGVCIGTVSGEHRILRCHGLTDASGRQAVDGTSRFGVASVSKTFTALAVLTLVREGAFGLDDPAESHLRSWRFPTGEFDGSAVTIRQLLTHTAGVGVPSYGGASTPPNGETTRDVLDGHGAGRVPVRLIAEPGSGFRYSGGGYMVLQQLVEDASGLPFERVVTERVFRPLGMSQSGFSWSPALDTDTAGHDVAGHPLARRSYGAAMAPGAMITTGDDMMRFVAAFADSTLPARLGWPDDAWAAFVARERTGYGMALVGGEANGHFLVGHSGTTMGYNAGFTVMPLERAGWFVLENGNGGPYLKAEIDRAFVGWKTGTVEPRSRVMRGLRAATAFAGGLLAGLGMLLLAMFAVSCKGGPPDLISTRRPGRLLVLTRLLIVAALIATLIGWVVFFHTDVFYPAFTTAWLPYPFRFVTLGVALLALRTALACVFVRRQQQGA